MKGSRRAARNYLNTLLIYPDRPFRNEPIIYPGTDRIIAQPAALPENRMYGKESLLLNIVRQELAEGRRCFLYRVYTYTRDITARLKDILTRHGIRTEILRSRVKPELREDWLRENDEARTFKWSSATRFSCKQDWTCWTSPPSSFTRPDIRSLPCVRLSPFMAHRPG